MDFEEALKEIFSPVVLDGYLMAENDPKEFKAIKIEVSFEQLIQLWNAGADMGANSIRAAIETVKKYK